MNAVNPSAPLQFPCGRSMPNLAAMRDGFDDQLPRSHEKKLQVFF